MPRVVSLPQPPRVYSQAYERAKNLRIEQLIQGSLGRNEIPIYGGLPAAQLTSDVVAFDVPQGAIPVILPFNVVTASNPDLLVGTVITPRFSMGTSISCKIHHLTQGGGNQVVNVKIYVYINGASAGFNSVSVDINDDDYIQFSGATPLVVGDVLDIRCSHSGTGNYNIRMVDSLLSILQMTPDPSFVER